MVIGNEYLLIWLVADKSIVLDYTQSLKGLNVEMGEMYKSYGAQSLAEIDQYCIDNGIVDTNNVVSPH